LLNCSGLFVLVSMNCLLFFKKSAATTYCKSPFITKSNEKR
jgi:hypothetical protein